MFKSNFEIDAILKPQEGIIQQLSVSEKEVFDVLLEIRILEKELLRLVFKVR